MSGQGTDSPNGKEGTATRRRRKTIVFLAVFSPLIALLLLTAVLFRLPASLGWPAEQETTAEVEESLSPEEEVDRPVPIKQLVLGKWEGRNEKGEKEGVEFVAEGVFRICWEGMDPLPGRYRFIDQNSVEIAFNLFYKFRAKLTVTAGQLVLTITDKGMTSEKVYRRVEEFSFAKGGTAEGHR
jgi:hypothetical protein